SVTFFFQAEDGIRDRNVTGVQTCALPISGLSADELRRFRVPLLRHQARALGDGVGELREAELRRRPQDDFLRPSRKVDGRESAQIGRASWRERVWMSVVAGEAREQQYDTE